MSRKNSNFFIEPRFQVFSIYSAIAAVYCSAFSAIYFYAAHDFLLGYVHLVGFIWVAVNWIVTRFTENYRRGVNFILADGTMVVSFLFATGGWEGSGYVWIFGYLPYAAFLTSMYGGLIWIAVLFLICLAMTILKTLGLIEWPFYSGIQIFNFFGAYLVFWLCIYFFQRALASYKVLFSEKQNELMHKNKELSKAKEEMELKNNEITETLRKVSAQKTEIEKINRFMIDREIRMTELKRENERLKEKKG